MAENTSIAWCYTWNPWLGFAKRRKASDAYWQKPLAWNRKAAKDGTRFQVSPSSCDPFEDWRGIIVNVSGHVLLKSGEAYTTEFTMNDLRHDMFRLTDWTPNLDWLLGTKRPENIRPMWPGGFRNNVWLLYSASNQESLEAGIGHLLACRDLVPVLGLSLEPLVGSVDLSEWLWDCESGMETRKTLGLPSIDWVIVGGESGPNARPCQVEWIEDIRRQCKAAGVPLFVKQDSGPKPGQQGHIPDDLWAVKEFPEGRS